METTTVNNYKKSLRITSIEFKACEYWDNGVRVVDPVTGLPANTECIILRGVDATLKGADILMCQDIYTVASVLKPEAIAATKAGIKIGDTFSAMVGIIHVTPFHRIMNGNIICDHLDVPKVYNTILVQQIWTDTKNIEQIALKMREDAMKKNQMTEVAVAEPQAVVVESAEQQAAPQGAQAPVQQGAPRPF